MPLINRCGGGGGTPQLCGQVENFKVVPGTVARTAVLSWTAPNPDEDNSFVGARIVRKTGSAPTGINDGTVVYEGTALTCTDTGLTAGTTYYYRAFAYNARTKYQTELRVVSVVATSLTLKPVLNDNTWADIKAASDAGIAASIWSVGDTKAITITSIPVYLTNSSSNTTDTNIDVDVFILGFNHNANVEGDNRIHFHIGKQSGEQIGIANLVSTGSAYWYSMQSTLNSTFKDKLPADLRAVLKTTTKYYLSWTTKNEGSTNVFNNVSVSDSLFLLSCTECLGAIASTAEGVGNTQKQYDYYRAGNTVVHKANNSQRIHIGSGTNTVYTDGSGQTLLRDRYETDYYIALDYFGKSYPTTTYTSPPTENLLLAPIFFV